jgi:hypothetical protein
MAAGWHRVFGKRFPSTLCTFPSLIEVKYTLPNNFRFRWKQQMKTYGKAGWTIERIKDELVYKTTWSSTIVADLVAEIERLQAIQGANGSDLPSPSSCARPAVHLTPMISGGTERGRDPDDDGLGSSCGDHGGMQGRQ